MAVARSSAYYEPLGESVYNLTLMRLLDEQYTRTPFYGVRRMTAWLGREGHVVDHKRVARLMGGMGIEAIYPRRRLSEPAEHREHRRSIARIRARSPKVYITLKGRGQVLPIETF
jgi:putative transposase